MSDVQTTEAPRENPFPIQEARENDTDLINEEVVELTPDVPSLFFKGPIREVIEQLREFEDGFCFVPVMRPKVPGDYYLANTYLAEDPTVIPEYSQTSEYYVLLKSYESLTSLADAMGDHLIANVAIQKQISVSLFDPSVSEDTPVVYYLNSYNRSTREKIILGFTFLAFNYMHRRSGTAKEDFQNVAGFLADEENYRKATGLLAEYPIPLKEFKRVCKKVGVPIKRIAYHMFNVAPDVWKAHEEKDATESLLYNFVRSRYAREESFNLLHLIQWLHDMYHFNTKNERYDVATKMLDAASTYLTKHLLPDAKISQLL